MVLGLREDPFHLPERSFAERTIPNTDAITIEQYRKLVLALQSTAPVARSRVILVTSALAGEGKSLTAANLALTLCNSYRMRVLLIDGDHRRPSVGQIFPSQALRVEVGANVGMQIFFINPLLSIAVPDPHGSADPISTLSSPEMHTFVEWGRQHADWIIIDSPPAALVPDPSILAPLADGVLLVLRAKTTPIEAVHRAMSGIGRDRIVGVVLNQVSPHHGDGMFQYYNQFRAYEQGSAGTTRVGDWDR